MHIACTVRHGKAHGNHYIILSFGFRASGFGFRAWDSSSSGSGYKVWGSRNLLQLKEYYKLPMPVTPVKTFQLLLQHRRTFSAFIGFSINKNHVSPIG